MSLHEETEFSKNFHRQLAELRREVDTVSGEHRAMLCMFADQVDRQHRRMQDNCANVHDIVDDLSLLVESTKFNLWAIQHEVK